MDVPLLSFGNHSVALGCTRPKTVLVGEAALTPLQIRKRQECRFPEGERLSYALLDGYS